MYSVFQLLQAFFQLFSAEILNSADLQDNNFQKFFIYYEFGLLYIEHIIPHPTLLFLSKQA
jgi:hypothetical protein